MTKRKKPVQLVQALDRALDIIEKLVQAENGLGVTELSNSTGLHKSTVYRLLATLNYRGYVKKDSMTNRYKVGLKLFEIGSFVLNNLDLRKQVRPYLKKLRKETKETTHLGILDQNEVVYIDKEETSEAIRMYSKIGRRVAAHCTSLGKILLAFSSAELVNRVIKEGGLSVYTENTITDPVEFKEHLNKVKKQGYAIDNEEQEEGIRCIGGPIFDYKGDIIAAFSIAGPTIRLTEELVEEELSELIINYSNKISSSFGYNKFI